MGAVGKVNYFSVCVEVCNESVSMLQNAIRRRASSFEGCDVRIVAPGQDSGVLDVIW